nr:MAG TPA: hypothetical protein [Caudoviricetes sp.]
MFLFRPNHYPRRKRSRICHYRLIFFALHQHLQCKNRPRPVQRSSRPNPYLVE